MSYQGYIGQLTRYIRKNLSKGYTIDSLKWALMDQGYSRSEIVRAIKMVDEELAKKAPKLIEKPVIKVEKYPINSDTLIETRSSKIKDFFKRIFR